MIGTNTHEAFKRRRPHQVQLWLGQALVGASGIVCAEPNLKNGTVLVRVGVIDLPRSASDHGYDGFTFTGREAEVSLAYITEVETD